VADARANRQALRVMLKHLEQNLSRLAHARR
jgi:hypothetical protein